MEHSSEDLLNILSQHKDPKYINEASTAMKTFFSKPHILVQRMQALRSQNYQPNQSGLDIFQIQKLFAAIELSQKDSQVLFLCVLILLNQNKSIDEISNQNDFKEYLKSPEEMKYFFVFILWKKLFNHQPYRMTLLKILEHIHKGAVYSQIFTIWIQDLSADLLKYMINNLNSTLNSICNKLIESQQTQQSNKILADYCTWICSFLKLIHTSNKNKHRVALTEFHNQALTNFFDPLEQFKIFITKSADFNFINFPFLLSFDYKYKLIQIESIYEQNNNIKQKMSMGLNSIIQTLSINGNFTMEGLIYLCLSVNRNNILDDSMDKLGKIKKSLKSPLRISFIGQEGTDEGGVKNQYFALITKAIFNPYLDMFLPKNNGRFYWFNGYSYQLPLRFQFVGMLLGLSLYNSVHLNIHFPEITYKKLLNKNYQQDYSIEIIQDLKQIQPDIYRTLKDILITEQPIDQLQLYFNIQLESFGQAIVEELVEDGNNTKVTNDNRQYYCLLYADYILNKHIAKQFIPFRRGFEKVVSGGIIQSFEPQQLRTIISGIEQIDIKQLQEGARYQGGYSAETPVIKFMWDFLHSLDLLQKKNFLTFITGTDRVPIEGLKSLKFMIQRHSNTNNLPTAHTCFNVLLLPEYQSRQILQKNMRLILEHNQGFGLI